MGAMAMGSERRIESSHWFRTIMVRVKLAKVLKSGQ